MGGQRVTRAYAIADLHAHEAELEQLAAART